MEILTEAHKVFLIERNSLDKTSKNLGTEFIQLVEDMRPLKKSEAVKKREKSVII